jgi:hypothetical protein
MTELDEKALHEAFAGSWYSAGDKELLAKRIRAYLSAAREPGSVVTPRFEVTDEFVRILLDRICYNDGFVRNAEQVRKSLQSQLSEALSSAPNGVGAGNWYARAIRAERELAQRPQPAQPAEGVVVDEALAAKLWRALEAERGKDNGRHATACMLAALRAVGLDKLGGGTTDALLKNSMEAHYQVVGECNKLRAQLAEAREALARAEERIAKYEEDISDDAGNTWQDYKRRYEQMMAERNVTQGELTEAREALAEANRLADEWRAERDRERELASAVHSDSRRDMERLQARIAELEAERDESVAKADEFAETAKRWHIRYLETNEGLQREFSRAADLQGRLGESDRQLACSRDRVRFLASRLEARDDAYDDLQGRLERLRERGEQLCSQWGVAAQGLRGADQEDWADCYEDCARSLWAALTATPPQQPAEPAPDWQARYEALRSECQDMVRESGWDGSSKIHHAPGWVQRLNRMAAEPAPAASPVPASQELAELQAAVAKQSRAIKIAAGHIMDLRGGDRGREIEQQIFDALESDAPPASDVSTSKDKP